MTHNPIYEFVKRQFPGQMVYFYSGIIILAYLPISRRYMRYLFPVSLFLLSGGEYLLLGIFELIAPTSIIITVAYEFKWLYVFNRMGNSSYGVFLIHFSITQILIHYGLDQYSFILTLTPTTVLGIGLDMLSWKCIEKPCSYHPKRKN